MVFPMSEQKVFSSPEVYLQRHAIEQPADGMYAGKKA